MMKSEKIFKKFFLVSGTLFGLFLTAPVQAICPVCTIAVGAGLGLSRWLGVDDTISGLWIGGLIVSLISWTNNWLAKKNIRFRADRLLIAVGYYLLILVPFYWTGFIGHPLHTFWGLDKLLLGIVLGSFGFLVGETIHSRLKRKNSGRIYFPFQKVVMPLGVLVILSIVFWFLTK